MVLHQTRASRRFLTTLTKFDPKSILSGPKNPNFDPVVRTGWDQCHREDYQILIPTIVHGSKSELKRSRYYENQDDVPIDAPQTSESHNFWSDRWIFKIHTFLETGSQDISKGVRIHTFFDFWGQGPLKGHRLEKRAKAIISPKHPTNQKRPHFFWSLPSAQPLYTFFFSLANSKKHKKKKCKVEFNQPSYWLYSVPNLLVF